MPTFISKLQYKNYEKGEFIDEQPRDLQQTLELIRNYPWDQQRGVDIQLTSPSVTIQNDNAEYLKLAIYFNGKFALYLYDNDQHLYELHEPTLDEACQVVEQFFNDNIDKSAFDKHFLAVGAKDHFETKDFIYSVNTTSVYLLFLLEFCICFILTISSVGLIFIKSAPAFLPILFLAMSLYCCYTASLQYRVYNKSKEMSLKISAGIPTFEFGESAYDRHIYNKNDILRVTFFGNVAGRGSQKMIIIRITFKDDSTITFSGFLIDPLDMLMKINGIPYITNGKTGAQISAIRDFTK